MEYVYAALLLDAAGNEISEKSIEDVVKAAGMQPDEAQAKAVAASLKGVNIKDVLKNAQSMQVAAAAPVRGRRAPRVGGAAGRHDQRSPPRMKRVVVSW